MSKLPGSQQGVVLVVVLVLLGIFMLIIVSVVGSSNINFKIAANQQYRVEAKVAAQHAIEEYISNPANFSVPLPPAFDIAVDIAGRGQPDYFVRMGAPNCLSSAPIDIERVWAMIEEDVSVAGCIMGDSTKSDILGDGGGGASLCSELAWNVRADVNDPISGAQIAMHQGVSLRAITGTPCPTL